MNPPKCVLCGANHWSYEGHKFPPDQKNNHTQDDGPVPKACPECRIMGKRIAELSAELKSVRDQLSAYTSQPVNTIVNKPVNSEQAVNTCEQTVNTPCEQPVDRKAYRREWTRKRREQVRQQKSSS